MLLVSRCVVLSGSGKHMKRQIKMCWEEWLITFSLMSILLNIAGILMRGTWKHLTLKM